MIIRREKKKDSIRRIEKVYCVTHSSKRVMVKWGEGGKGGSEVVIVEFLKGGGEVFKKRFHRNPKVSLH